MIDEEQESVKRAVAKYAITLSRFPELVPVTVTYRMPLQHTDAPPVKLMISRRMKMIQLKHIIRSKLKLKETESLFMFIDGSKLQAQGKARPTIDLTLEEVYQRHRGHHDEVLKIVCQNTETF